MKKIFKVFFYSLTVILILQGCNLNDRDQVSSPPKDLPKENEAPALNNKQDDQSFPFIEFDLDVDYKDQKSFEVSYENDREGMSAEYEDTINNEILRGDEAFERLRPIFESMTFDKNTEENEVISQVVDAFQLNTDYLKLELEITFTDGTKREYRS